MIRQYGCYDKHREPGRLIVRTAHLCPGGSDRFGYLVCEGYRFPFVFFGLYSDTGDLEGCPSGVIGCEEMVNGTLMPVFEIDETEEFGSLEELIEYCCYQGDNCENCAWTMKNPRAVKVTFSGIESSTPCIQATDSIHTVHLPIPSHLLNGSFLLPRSVINPPQCLWELCLEVSIPWTRYTGPNCTGEVYDPGEGILGRGVAKKMKISVSVSATRMSVGMSIYDGFMPGLGSVDTAVLFSGYRDLTRPRPWCINTDVYVDNGVRYLYFHIMPHNTYPKYIGINGTAYVEHVWGDPFPAWISSHEYKAGDGVTVDNIHYCCHTAHTSDTTNRPGSGVNWYLYWYIIDDNCGRV